MTCRRCGLRMKELKGHIFHNQRKFRCEKCGSHRMQQQKPKTKER